MRLQSYNIMMQAANKLAIKYAKKFFLASLSPVDYTRTKEIPAILDVSGILKKRNENIRILDIGSPQILSLSLSIYSNSWDIVYVNSFKMEIEDLRQKALILGLRNLDIRYGDITSSEMISNIGIFDYIFSCSVFEHIHPENGGDIIASRNVSSLLKKGGIFSFSVPYYKKAFNEYKESDVYSIKGTPGGKTFFQRFYDKETLLSNIIKPSDLNILYAKYIGERFYQVGNINKRMAHLIGSGKMSFFLGRFFNLISDIFMVESKDDNKLKKPYLAIYSLKKHH